MPQPDNENDLNSPLYLVEKLNSRRTEIQTFITRLDSEPFTTMSELPDVIPSFLIAPTYLDVGIDWFYFKVLIIYLFISLLIFFVYSIQSFLLLNAEVYLQ